MSEESYSQAIARITAEYAEKPEALAELVEKLPDYQRWDKIVTVEISYELWTPGLLHAFANFAETVIADIPGAVLDGLTVKVPKDLDVLESLAIQNEKYRRDQ
jgi:hypothetical protein